MGINRHEKLCIKNDATLGANHEAKHGVDMVAKKDVTLDGQYGAT